MSLRLTVPEQPSATDRDAVLAPLLAYNDSRVGNPQVQPVAILLTDEIGNHVGGLWGKLLYDWLIVELVSVPEQYRNGGYGSQLVRQAEQIAKSKNCVGIWLDTFEFQARGFYEKLGFELFGELPDHPRGQKRFFLRKILPQRQL